MKVNYLNDIKRYNRAKVLNCIRLHAPISRSAIAKKTSLDKKTITNIISDWEQKHYILETGEKSKTDGRPQILLKLNDQNVHCLAINIQQDYLECALISIEGTILAIQQVQCDAKIKSSILASMKKCVDEMTKGYKSSKAFHTAIVIPGLIDQHNKEVIISSITPGLNQTKFKEFNHSRFKTLIVENSSKAVTIAEKWFGVCKALNDYICIDLSAGVGSGLIIGRELYKGFGDMAGEIGHIIVEKNGKPCSCGKKGCLQAYISESVFKPLLRLPDSDQRIKSIPSSMKKNLITAGNKLGIALASVVNLISPAAIVISGKVSRFHSILLPEIIKSMKQYGLESNVSITKILFSELKHAALLGAACNVLSKEYEVKGFYTV